MDIYKRNEVMEDLHSKNTRLWTAIGCLTTVLAFQFIKLYVLSDIRITQTGNIQNNTVITKHSFDIGGQRALVSSFVGDLSSVNAINIEDTKASLSVLMSPESYTQLNKAINHRVEFLHGVGGTFANYLIETDHAFDPTTSTHTVTGVMHKYTSDSNKAADVTEGEITFVVHGHMDHYRYLIDSVSAPDFFHTKKEPLL